MSSSSSSSSNNVNRGDELDLDWEEWDPNESSFINHMVAGSFAGLAEHVAMFPLDTVKTHIQCERCGSASPLKTLQCAKRLVNNEGVMRLWRGVSATFSGCIPAHAAYFSIYESSKRMLGVDQSGHFPIQAAICGASAAFAHDLCMTPFDTVKQRMQLGYYKSVFHCSKKIINIEGFGALFVSLPATLMMNLPYGMIMVAVNESAKEIINPTGTYSIFSIMLCGSIAGATAAGLTTPLDIIKTRLQTQNLVPIYSPQGGSSSSSGVGSSPSASSSVNYRTNSNTSSSIYSIGRRNIANYADGNRNFYQHLVRYLYSSTVIATKEIFVEAGAKGYFRGLVPRIMVHAPAVGISWTAYETAKNFLSKQNV